MTALTEPFHAGGYIVSEANGHRSRETVTIKSGADLLAGTVLGKITTGAQSVGAPAAFASNAGDGSPGTFTADAGAPAGDYKIVFIEPVTNLGTFQVFKPDGTLDGTGKVGTAYNGSINGTIADGTNDFVAGDGFTVTVSYAAGSGKYAIHDPSASDGTQNAIAILYADAAAASADKVATITARDTEVNASELVWKSGMTDNQKTAATTALAAYGIIAR